MTLETCLVSLDFDRADADELRQVAARSVDDASAVEQYISSLQQDEQTLRDQLTEQGIDAQPQSIEQAAQEIDDVVQAVAEQATDDDLRQIDEAIGEDLDTVAPILYQRYDMPDSQADQQRPDGTHPFQMSTRVPSAKTTAGQAEQAVHDGEPLSIGVEHVLQLAPEQLQKLAGVLKTHAGFSTKSRKPEKVIDEYIEHVKDNLVWLHDLVLEQYPELIERSHQWYDGARRITTEWSKIYGVPDRSVAAVLAALSPQMDWFKNVTLAQRVLDIHSHLTTGNTVGMPALDSMREWVEQKYAPRAKPANWEKKSAKRKAEWLREEQSAAKKLAEYRELFAGSTTYADLPEGQEGDISRAMWLRAYDEAENPKTYRIVTPEGAFGELATKGDGTPSSATWGSFREIAKAISAMRDPSVEGISGYIGGEHKVRNFYNNILTPNSPRGEVTIDTHAVAASLMLPLGGSDNEVLQNFGGGGAPSSSVTGAQGIYGLLAEAHRRAAADPRINRLPRQVQSITWEAIRSIFLPTFKTKENKAAVQAVWAQYERGAISKDAARSRIVEMAGGLRAPEWASSDDTRDTATDPSRLPSYDGELAGRNIRQRQYAEGFGFGDVSTGDGDTVGIGPQIRRTLFQRDSDGPQAAGERPDSDRLGRGGLADALVSSKQGAVRLTGKNGRSRLKGLEKGSPGAVPGLREAAADYARQAGIEHDHQAEYARVDIERAQRIAQAYEDMQHAPNDPAVQASYDAMIRETIAQYEYILSLGYTFTPMVEGFENVYPTVNEALEDLSVNKHLWFFPTDFGYGTNEDGTPGQIPDSEIAENPLLAWTDYEINGQRLRANDIFRIVHDVFGHGVEGSLFRGRGEENAWQAHIRLYSDEAAGAVTSETRGQNSWLNYGPMGEANRTALTEDTVFAEQKIGLMPEWTWREGRAVNEADAKQTHEERKAILEANDAIERTAPAPATRREQAVFGLRRRFVDASSGRIRGVTGGRRRDGENGRLVASDELVSAFTQAGYSAPAVVETDAATFVKLIEQSKAESKFGAAVYVYPESAYEDMQLWVTDDGKAGFAVKSDGDIVSVFNLQGSPHKGVVPYFLALAVHQGGTKLDAFDTILPYLYGASGFVEVGRDTWNEEYKPDGWDYKTFESFAFGRPGVVYMEYRNAEQPYRSEADLTRTLFQSDGVEHDLLSPPGQSRMIGSETVLLDTPDLLVAQSDYVTDAGRMLRYVRKDNGVPIGVLQIRTHGKRSKKATIANVYTVESRRREKVASGLLRRAQQDFDVKHSTDLTAAGRAFAEADGRYYQPAYHGTPHKVDRFSLQKIGTGEGAQAFGWGLYFAESRGVAKDYQRKLATRRWQIPDAEIADDGQLAKQIEDLFFQENDEAMQALLDEHTVERIEISSGHAFIGSQTLHKLSDNSAVVISEEDPVPAPYKNFDEVKPPTGNLYTVDIADSAVENMLDWDAPMSEQPQSVKQALKNILPELVSTKLANGLYGLGFLEPDGSARNIIGIQAETAEEARKQFTGSEAYKHIQNKIGKEAGFTGSDKAASEALNAAGIPGVKYFDRSSRAAGEGTRNFVVWDEDAITMLEENGQPISDQEKRAILNQPAAEAQPAPLGATEFQPEKTIVTLFESADKSTFLHESGHVFVELLERMALAPDAPQRIKDIYADMLRHVGAQNAYDMDAFDPAKTQEERDAARDRQEILARSFEKYLMEGKAPSVQLRSAFAAFRRWLTFVYTRLRKLGTTLSPEINDVFDRMLATDEELAIMRQAKAMDANASPSIVAMMTGPDAAKYLVMQEEAEELDREQQLLITAELEQAEKEAEWQAAYEAEQKQVTAELYARPEYKAWLFLTGGTLPPEPDVPISQVTLRQRLQGKRLNKKAMVDAGFTAKELADIPRGPRGRAVYAPDGDSPEILAAALGYSDGALLMEAMRDLAPPQPVIDAEATRRVRERLGDPANDGTRERLIKESLYHEARQKVIRAELNALAKAAGKPSTTRAMARAMADEIISTTPIARLLSPLKYEAAAIRHAQEAERRASAGDLMGAYQSKQLHLLNHELFRKGLKIRDSVTRRRKRLRKLQTQKIDPKRVAPEYIGQIKTLLNLFGLKESPKQWQAAGRITPEMQALASAVMSWIDNKQAQGEALSVPGELITVGNFDENGNQPTAFMLKHWSEMTANEFDALNDLATMLENLGRRNSEAERINRSMEYMRLASGIREATKAKPRRTVKGGRVPTAKQEQAEGARGWFQASHRKLESLLRQVDGFVELGPMWQAVFKPIQDGENVKNELSAKIVKGMDKIFSVYSFEEKRRMRTDGANWYSSNLLFGSAKKVPGITADVTLTHEERLVIALNAGNESSYKALLADKQLQDLFTPRDQSGNPIAETEWNDASIQAVLDMLTDKDIKVVEGIFDLVDSFWEDVKDDNGKLITIGIKNLEKQETGVVPPKVKAVPFFSNGKMVKGGYYPLKYNPHASERVAREGEMDIANALSGGYPGSAMTSHNHTIARKGSGGRPIRLGLDVLTEHFEQVTHDLAFRQAVVNADRILTDSAISDAIKDELKESGLREMRRTIITVAQGRAAPITPAGKFARSIRMKASNAIMGLNLRSILTQPLGLLQSIDQLGPVYMARGVAQWYLSGSKPGSHLLAAQLPVYAQYKLARQVFAKSVFMRNRARVATRELNEVQNKIEIEMIGRAKRATQQVAFAPMLFLDVYSVAMPTWLGGYEKALAGNVKGVPAGDEAAAIDYADSLVRRTQGTGGNLNLSNIQSLDELSKLVTMFGSYFNTTYNLQAEAWNQFRQSEGFVEGSRNFGAFLYHSTLLTLIPGAIGAIVLESFTAEDEEKMTYAEWLAMHTLLYATGQMFFVRDIATGLASGFEPSFTPAESVFSAVVGGGKEVAEFVSDDDYEFDQAAAKTLARAVGYAGGIPGTTQMIRSTEWLYNYSAGNLENDVEDIWTPEGMQRVLLTGDR